MPAGFCYVHQLPRECSICVVSLSILCREVYRCMPWFCASHELCLYAWVAAQHVFLSSNSMYSGIIYDGHSLQSAS